MFTVGADEALTAAALEIDGVEIGANRAALGAREVNAPGRCIDAVERSHLPVSARELASELAAGIVVIEVTPAVPFAQPEKALSFFDPCPVALCFDPGFVLLDENRPSSPRDGVAEKDAIDVLFSVQLLNDDLRVVGSPGEL